jgi:hypothetical protein
MENSAAVDRYLNAFEKGTLDDEDPDIQARLTNLRKQSTQLRADKTRLEFDLDQPPTGPAPEDLALISNQITEIITTGGHQGQGGTLRGTHRRHRDPGRRQRDPALPHPDRQQRRRASP